MPKTATKRAPEAPPLAKLVGRQVRALRDRQGLTQQQLAERAGMLQQTLARLEKGQRGVTVDDLFQISAALDVAPVELLAATFEAADVPVTGKVKLDPVDARQWVCGFQPLPDADAQLYHRQAPAGISELDHRRPSLGLARHDLYGWERAAVSGDIDEEEHSIRLLLDRARNGLRDLKTHHSEYFTSDREARRAQWREQLGWED